MTNDCWNNVTIVCENRYLADELTQLIINELQYENEGKYVYNDNVTVRQRGIQGIEFELWTECNPQYEWLHELLDKYPNCWIKNEWYEEGGLAGVWIGYVKNNQKFINEMSWEDIGLEGRYYFFLPDTGEHSD
jgi:hypothetical protein